MAVAKIVNGLQSCLYIGNLNAKRDWGYAPDYVKLMWMILQQERPDDYVAATGEAHSVREFIEAAFSFVGISLAWKGDGVDEIGYDKKNNKILVRIDPRYFRPTEVDFLLGSSQKAREKLGWKPSVNFEQLVEIMVRADLDLLKKHGEE